MGVETTVKACAFGFSDKDTGVEAMACSKEKWNLSFKKRCGLFWGLKQKGN